MENLVTGHEFWQGRRVLLTGHTGFKGGWTALWLTAMGAEVHGFSLPPQTERGIFCSARIESQLASQCLGDIRDAGALQEYVQQVSPELVLHMAAQPLVRRSYAKPLETYAVNVMGTLQLLESIRQLDSVQAILLVSSDKCYQNHEQWHAYREDEQMGGCDPYSSSKACMELAVAAWRQSFFCGEASPAVMSLRAGNVIGGGDWAEDRLIPDAMRTMEQGECLHLRYPDNVRPWQHVLDCIAGYLALAEQALGPQGKALEGPWNFGPVHTRPYSVLQVIESLAAYSSGRLRWEVRREADAPPESGLLLLDSHKAMAQLAWRPRWDCQQALAHTWAWYDAQRKGGDMYQVSLAQLYGYLAGASLA